MKRTETYRFIQLRLAWCAFILFLAIAASAQVKAYTIKNGRMYIQLSRDISPAALDSFITQFELQDLGLKTFLKSNKSDSLLQQGWKIEWNNETGFIISKSFDPFPNDNFSDKIMLEERKALFPALNNGVTYGVNKFKNKFSFAVKDSIVTFFLRNRKEANRVMLAGSFNNWMPDNLPMQKTDSGWIAKVKLGIGKYWYKFIVDDNWIIDADNGLQESDGEGNINSVYYKPNVLMTLEGFENAKKVYLSGSFNNWREKELLMTKAGNVWQLPLYLAQGTHTYKFIIDGQWYSDPGRDKLPDGVGGYNSVIRIGNPYLFKLNGYGNAKKVVLSGSFNGWQHEELLMNKTATGWELPYTLGPGNYEYKFIVDGKWISDPANNFTSSFSGNSFLIIEPNHTFRLKNFSGAKKVFLAGDFNNWDPQGYAMKREGDDWVFSVHLSAGKHLYKFYVDGQWIIDPGNKLWEQNEYGTGNSIIWIEE